MICAIGIGLYVAGWAWLLYLLKTAPTQTRRGGYASMKEVIFTLCTNGGTVVHSTYREFPKDAPDSVIEDALESWANECKEEMSAEWE